LLKYHRSGAQKKVLFRWLVTITSLYFLLMVSNLLVFVFAPAHQWLLGSICIMTFFFIISLVLFSNPDLLYGHYLNDEALKEKAGKKIKQVVLSIEKVTEL